jgi:hypothetical protein
VVWLKFNEGIRGGLDWRWAATRGCCCCLLVDCGSTLLESECISPDGPLTHWQASLMPTWVHLCFPLELPLFFLPILVTSANKSLSDFSNFSWVCSPCLTPLTCSYILSASSPRLDSLLELWVLQASSNLDLDSQEAALGSSGCPFVIRSHHSLCISVIFPTVNVCLLKAGTWHVLRGGVGCRHRAWCSVSHQIPVTG